MSRVNPRTRATSSSDSEQSSSPRAPGEQSPVTSPIVAAKQTDIASFFIRKPSLRDVSNVSDMPVKKKAKKQTGVQLHFTGGKSIKTCAVCGMTYSSIDAADDQTHKAFHKKAVSGLPWPKSAQKHAELLCEISQDATVYTLHCISQLSGPAIDNVMHTIDTQLGASDLALEQLEKSKLYVLVSKDNRIVSAVLAEKIEEAREIVRSDAGDGETKTNTEHGATRVDLGDSQAIFCSSETTPVLFGIQRIWTASDHRRKGFATYLLNAAAAHFVYGQPVSFIGRRRHVAFSQPTASGYALARSWTQSDIFMVF